MTLAPYPKYRPSGIEWLGDVPEHWVLRRSDAVIEATRRQIDREAFTDQEVVHYSIPAVQEEGTGTIQHGSEIESGKQVISDSVVLVSRLNPRKSTICRAAPHQHLLTIASVEFVALRPVSTEIGFVFYLMQSELVRQRLDAGVQSVTRSHQRVDADDIRRFWHAWPPKEEQKAISAFLDEEAAKLDAIVRKQQTLIERLREKRSALITETVTRGLPPDAARAAGLDPHPPRKPSGVEWLGNIPAHWTVMPIKRRYGIVSGGTPSTTEPAYWEGGIVWMTPEDLGGVRTRCVSASRRTLSREGVANCGSEIVPAGTVIISTRAPIGHLAVATVPVCTNQGCRSLVPVSDEEPTDYLYYALASARQVLLSSGKGSTFSELSAHGLGSHRVAFPPRPEQQAIAGYLDRETAKLDALVAKIQTAGERLREYRSALITAAVTGKVDVRSARQPAPADRGSANEARRS